MSCQGENEHSVTAGTSFICTQKWDNSCKVPTNEISRLILNQTIRISGPNVLGLICLHSGAGTGKVFARQASAALVPFWVTLPFPHENSVVFSGVCQHHWATGEGHPPKPTTGCFLPSPMGHKCLALPLNYAWLFLPLTSLPQVSAWLDKL